MNYGRAPKTVLITGAQGALGRATTERFLKAGCRVTGTDVRIADPSTGTHGNLLRWVEADLADERAVEKLALDDDGKPVEAWIHCAGGFRWAETGDLKPEDFEFLLNANLRSTFNLARAIVPQMKRASYGRIVLVSARATLAAGAGMAAYAASKAGINSLTTALADEVKPFDINVNAVLPTTLDTPANRAAMPKADPKTWVSLDEMAEILYGLTQPWSRPIHGALIPVVGRV